MTRRIGRTQPTACVLRLAYRLRRGHTFRIGGNETDGMSGLGQISRKTAGILGLPAAMTAFVLDQAHKYWMVHIYALPLGKRVEVTPFFDLVHVRNHGISYGLLRQDSDTGRYLLIGFALAAIAALAAWMLNAGTRLAALSLGFIIGGALGNVLDRIVYGSVADFFSFHYAGYYWYIFNVADVAIAAGVIGLFADWIFMPTAVARAK
jgi:signal peptidase II